jgi:sugar lactone lactonase YvrE
MAKGHVYAIAKLRHVATTVAVDPHGNFVLANPGASKIVVLARRTGVFYGRAMTAGRTYPVAGTGAAGRTGDGGPAVSAQLYRPQSVVVDHNGSLVIADTANSRIRVVAAKTGW